MTEDSPTYYPPRAKWYGWLRYPWYRLWRMTGLDAISRRTGLRPRALFSCLIVPGYALAVYERRKLGMAVLTMYGLATVVFVATLGTPPVDVYFGVTFRFEPEYLAFGIMIALHSISLISLVFKLVGDVDFATRLLIGLAITLFYSACVYWPIFRLAQRHLLKRVEAVTGTVGLAAGGLGQDWDGKTLVQRAASVYVMPEQEGGAGCLSPVA